ncbi:MAG: hypothetical protein ACQSGP_20140 [Frankia sp.]
MSDPTEPVGPVHQEPVPSEPVGPERGPGRLAAVVRPLLVVGALVVVIALVYGIYLGPHRAAGQRHSQRVAVCDIADVIVDSGKYPGLEKFVPVEWRFVRGAAAGTHDRNLADLARALPAAPDPPAMKSVAAYCHAHGLGVVLRGQ